MRFKASGQYLGALLVLVLSLTSIWLYFDKTLTLYIHPRYELFTLCMCVLAAGLSIASLALPYARNSNSNIHKSSIGSVIITILITASIVLMKPTTLSSRTVSQRGINSSSFTMNEIVAADALQSFGNNYANLSVKDWSSLLLQSSGSDFLYGKEADVSGFITTIEGAPSDSFYIARFIVTCCAVDARPIGLPVRLENWQQTYKKDSWVHIRGTFNKHPDTGTFMLIPSVIESIPVPKEPYVY